MQSPQFQNNRHIFSLKLFSTAIWPYHTIRTLDYITTAPLQTHHITVGPSYKESNISFTLSCGGKTADIDRHCWLSFRGSRNKKRWHWSTNNTSGKIMIYLDPIRSDNHSRSFKWLTGVTEKSTPIAANTSTIRIGHTSFLRIPGQFLWIDRHGSIWIAIVGQASW